MYYPHQFHACRQGGFGANTYWQTDEHKQTRAFSRRAKVQACIRLKDFPNLIKIGQLVKVSGRTDSWNTSTDLVASTWQCIGK